MFAGIKSFRALSAARTVLLTAAAVAGCWPPAAALAQTPAADSAELAKAIGERIGIRRGLCAVVGSDSSLALPLAKQSELLIHVRNPSRRSAQEVGQQADEAGLGIDRLLAQQGSAEKLPHADNLLDVVLLSSASRETLDQFAPAEVLRALRPLGVALVGARAESPGATAGVNDLRAWLEGAAVQDVETFDDETGSWIRFRKPPLAGADEWTHWEKSPDNNPVSSDTVIKAPYMTQFMSHPLYIGMPSITTAAGGRTFLAIGHISHHPREWDMLNKIIARNGYNGVKLWERKLPEGYVVHRSAFVATADAFHMIDGDRCLVLDPQTGREQGEIRIPGLAGDWKWMAMQDGVLYVLAGKPEPGAEIVKGDRSFGGWSWADLSRGYYGKRVPYGFGDSLAAYDLASKQPLWIHKEQSLIDSRGLSISTGRLFLYCPDRHLRGLSLKSGQPLWTNDDAEVLELIEQPGRNLTSTPGFRTACLAVSGPQAVVIQGQTRNNVIAIAADDGRLLWKKQKVTNNPNAIFVDDKVVLGVGPGGTHVALDPVSGEVLEDLKFRKTACTRLTACADSFFCRGEGTLRFDRATSRVSIDGGARPGCNDGAMPANGLLYIGPWQCDCNLSLIGRVAKCSAGDFQFDLEATAENLQRFADDVQQVEPLEIDSADWPTYRANNQRTAGSEAKVAAQLRPKWRFSPDRLVTPTTVTAAGGLVFTAGNDGKVRAIDAKSGEQAWTFAAGGIVKYPPTIADGRAYFGAGDGFAYCLEAVTGRLLWRFRAAPVERQIMVYGNLSSTWPVHSGVLVNDGVAYFAGGIIDHDGTYVYALDAVTGEINWQNNSSGHLDPLLRKGVSVQGNLALLGDQLLLAGGNQVSPAPFDIKTGELQVSKPRPQGAGDRAAQRAAPLGRPRANNGRFVGVFKDVSAIAGGRILHSAPENVSTKGGFVAFSSRNAYRLNNGGVPPAWSNETLAMVNFKHGQITCCDAEQVADRIEKGYGEASNLGRRRWLNNLAAALEQDGSVRWQSDLGESEKFEAISLAVCQNAVVGIVKYQDKFRARPQWSLVVFDSQTGAARFRQFLDGEPLPDGLAIDRDGRVHIAMIGGDIVCFGPAG